MMARARSCASILSMAWQAVQEMNRQTGANVDPNQDPSELMNSNTRGLMNAVHQLPALVERKGTIEKHSSLLHALLKVGLCSNAESQVCLCWLQITWG